VFEAGMICSCQPLADAVRPNANWVPVLLKGNLEFETSLHMGVSCYATKLCLLVYERWFESRHIYATTEKKWRTVSGGGRSVLLASRRYKVGLTTMAAPR
jgi:hypothetical protein